MNGAKEETTTAELTSGVRIPLIGLGTWPLTGEDAAAAVVQAVGTGYRHIDTAENYANEAAWGKGSAGAESSAGSIPSTASPDNFPSTVRTGYAPPRTARSAATAAFLAHPAVSGPAADLEKTPAQIVLAGASSTAASPYPSPRTSNVSAKTSTSSASN